MGKKLIVNLGEKHKNWLIIREVESKGNHRYFLCKCLLCDNEYELQMHNLLNETKCFCCQSCAISIRHERKAAELIGQVFGRLTVVSMHSQDKYNNWKYLCACSCGNQKVILGRSLKTNKSTSCGCYNSELVRERSSGENSHLWKGGTSTQIETDRAVIIQQINPRIRIRDNYTCQNCGQYGGYLECHHIYDFSTYQELRFEEYNLITLCKTCHKKFHSIYPTTSSNTLDDLEIFLNHEYLYNSELIHSYNSHYIK